MRRTLIRWCAAGLFAMAAAIAVSPVGQASAVDNTVSALDSIPGCPGSRC